MAEADTLSSPLDVFSRIAPARFRERVVEVIDGSLFYRNNLDLKNSYDACECWLSGDQQAGFAVTQERELLNVFSLVRGRGDGLVAFAVSRYPVLQLNCYEGYLEYMYARHGFEVVARDPNWTTGPDVVTMRRNGMILTR